MKLNGNPYLEHGPRGHGRCPVRNGPLQGVGEIQRTRVPSQTVLGDICPRVAQPASMFPDQRIASSYHTACLMCHIRGYCPLAASTHLPLLRTFSCSSVSGHRCIQVSWLASKRQRIGNAIHATSVPLCRCGGRSSDGFSKARVDGWSEVECCSGHFLHWA